MTDSKIPIEQLYEKIQSIYKLVILASRRALELNAGAANLSQQEADNVAQAALKEIVEEKISYKDGKTTKDEK